MKPNKTKRYHAKFFIKGHDPVTHSIPRKMYGQYMKLLDVYRQPDGKIKLNDIVVSDEDVHTIEFVETEE